ncbi:MAG: glycosyltransferase family 1 protein [Gammaproteobacteria bacterium]|nr:glycosyltransferase family 1 protein [Gammaproteobacteria bacterium]
MHITDITMFYAPQSGGVRTYLTAKHRALTAMPGVRHSIVVPGAADGEADGIHTVAAPPIPYGNGYRCPLRTGAWRRRLERLRPDVIEAGDPYRLAWAALAAGDRLGVPVVGFYHSDLPRLVGARFGDAWGGLAAAYVRRLYARFDLTLAPSRVMADYLESLGVPRVAVQPLGVDTTLFHPAKRDAGLRRELGLSGRTRLLVFAGRGAREKNIPVLLETLQRLGPHYHLLLIGPGMPVRDIPANVTVCPRYHDGAALSRWLASADAFIHAGAQETFGLVVLEAMASGLPVIGVNAGAVAELVAPGTGLLAQRADAPALAEAVEYLSALDLAAMGRLARARIEAHWSWDCVFRQLLARYAGLIRSGAPRALAPAHYAR